MIISILFSDNIMDLTKLRKMDYNISFNVTDLDILSLVERGRGIIASKYFPDSMSSVDLFHVSFDDMINLYVGHMQDEEERYFYHIIAKLSNGTVIDREFWNFSIIPIMTLDALKSWKPLRKISISLHVGIYEGEGSVEEWQNILTKVDDFTPVCYPQSFHTLMMDDILAAGKYTDARLQFPNGKELFVHKCFLEASSPYFRAFFSGKFETDSSINILDFDYQLVKEVISYIYSGRMKEEMIENWTEVYKFARFYHLDILARHAELQIMVGAPKDINEVKKFLKFAMIYGAYRLKQFIINRIRYIQETVECKRYRGIFSLQ